MGIIRQPQPVLLLIAAFSPDMNVLNQGKLLATDTFGPLYAESELFRFDEFTNYYDEEMGPVLYKQLWCFDAPILPDALARIKVQTNGWEEEFAEAFSASVNSRRPLNLDPGYIDPGKLILASTKDHAHRIYLGRGIFAETTLMYTQKHWQALPWSYPDYQSPGYQAFLSQCREQIKKLRTETARAGHGTKKKEK
ncbi:MAG: DUF4416 family protein [Thermoguttaceae bacterium]|nr:DUF4416 family protein [Thermoguttaceae bacterium]